MVTRWVIECGDKVIEVSRVVFLQFISKQKMGVWHQLEGQCEPIHAHKVACVVRLERRPTCK